MGDTAVSKEANRTYAGQDSLKRLPIPTLEDTVKRYLSAVKPLQVCRNYINLTIVPERVYQDASSSEGISRKGWPESTTTAARLRQNTSFLH